MEPGIAADCTVPGVGANHLHVWLAASRLYPPFVVRVM
jgi:hypothetical protein